MTAREVRHRRRTRSEGRCLVAVRHRWLPAGPWHRCSSCGQVSIGAVR